MTTPPRARVFLLLAAAAVAASACAQHAPRVRVLPPAAYEPAPPGAAPAPIPAPTLAATAAGLEIARLARMLVGAPYREGGALPDGFDCSGLVNYVFARQGVAVPRDVRRQALAGEPVDRVNVAPGDLVFFATTGSGPTHVGIAVGNGQFIHAPKSGDVVRVESMSAAYWASRFVTARRITVPGEHQSCRP
jgi:cell wall-associated NlpC family hydrolase